MLHLRRHLNPPTGGIVDLKSTDIHINASFPVSPQWVNPEGFVELMHWRLLATLRHG